MFEALKHAGVGEKFFSIIRDVYRKAVTNYIMTKGQSTPHVAAAGVRQGNPLSGVLFILAINFILVKIQREGSVIDPGTKEMFHFILAHADDMLLIARSAKDLQALLHLINVLAVKIGLKFNHYSSKLPAGCPDQTFNLAGSDLPFMTDGNPTKFLGKLISTFLPQDSVMVDRRRGD